MMRRAKKNRIEVFSKTSWILK